MSRGIQAKLAGSRWTELEKGRYELNLLETSFLTTKNDISHSVREPIRARQAYTRTRHCVYKAHDSFFGLEGRRIVSSF